MKKRDTLLALLALGAAPFAAMAQQPPRVWRLGWLSAVSRQADESGPLSAFLKAMSELGYAEGKNILIEYRYADGTNSRLRDFAADLVRLKVDVIVAPGALAAQPAHAATKLIPIVAMTGDFVATGLAASLARPGGNITGVTNFSPDLIGKRLELLKELVPGIVRVAVLWDPEGPGPIITYKTAREAAARLRLQVLSLEVRGPKPDLDAAFKAAINGRARGIVTISNPLINAHRTQIVEHVAKNRLPAIYADGNFMDSGGLMSYGPNIHALFGRVAYYVDRILKGAKPADLPVEQPTKFELIINMKTAKALGLAIPQSIVLRADRVIE